MPLPICPIDGASGSNRKSQYQTSGMLHAVSDRVKSFGHTRATPDPAHHGDILDSVTHRAPCGHIILEGQRCESVGQVAVLAAAAGPPSDLWLQRARDGHDDSRGGLLESQSSLGMQQVQKISHQKIALEFLLSSLRQ